MNARERGSKSRRAGRGFASRRRWAFVTTAGFCATTQTPRAIVEEYCSLDARGADFSSSNPNAEVVWRLLIDGDDAGYDRAVIIRSYHVGEPTVGKSGEDVVVT